MVGEKLKQSGCETTLIAKEIRENGTHPFSQWERTQGVDGKVKRGGGSRSFRLKVFNILLAWAGKDCSMLVREVGWCGRLRKRSRMHVYVCVCVWFLGFFK